jgi:hypothetical protein
MIQMGRMLILLWALAIAYLAFLLIRGQGMVAINALAAGQITEAIMQFTFISIVFVATVAAVALFLVVGVSRETAQ